MSRISTAMMMRRMIFLICIDSYPPPLVLIPSTMPTPTSQGEEPGMGMFVCMGLRRRGRTGGGMLPPRRSIRLLRRRVGYPYINIFSFTHVILELRSDRL